MDGFQGKISQSLQFRLSAGLSLAILAVALVAGVFSFVSAFKEAIELQDDQLRQMASLVRRQRLPLVSAVPPTDIADPDPESRVMVQLLLPPDARAQPADASAGLSADLPDGLQTVAVGGLSWRLFVTTLDSGARVAVGQQTAVRDEIARDSALRTLTPLLILIPILLLLVGTLIRKMFQPLKMAAAELDRRTEQDLRAIADTGLPSEIHPFVVAINRLLARVAQSVAMQRRFVADAAHELRSPLTALSLQAEGLEAAQMSQQARARLAALRQGIQRTRALLDQLLTLARVQQSPHGQSASVSIRQVFRQVLEDLLPLAEAKSIDLGVLDEVDADVAARGLDLITLVRNLVDNAIRYTPDGGRIDLSVRSGERGVLLQVADTGPGIPAAERQRVFDPFYRALGNEALGAGLGLSIVQAIAARLGAQVELDYSDRSVQSGLLVTVIFPPADRPASL